MAEVRLVREGKTEFFVPSSLELRKKGPGKKDKFGFYNPAMAESRDISVAVVQAMLNESNRELRVLDGLSSVGARGLRIANEVRGEFKVILNDWDERAIEIARKSIEHNDLRNVETRCENLNVLLCKEKFNYIDIDPFGSPVPYVSMAVRSILPGGILAFTATDTATLCGVYRKTCLRRYNAESLRTWAMHEIGLRILIGYIIKEGARFERALYPILSYSRNYYMRVYFRVKNGARRADKLLENISITKALDFNFKPREVGPLWLGELHDRDFLLSVKRAAKEVELSNRKEVGKLLDRCLEETGMPPFFYDIDALSSYFRKSPPKISRMMRLLEKEGFRVSRTHFRDTSFKTDAPLDEVMKTFRDLTI